MFIRLNLKDYGLADVEIVFRKLFGDMFFYDFFFFFCGEGNSPMKFVQTFTYAL